MLNWKPYRKAIYFRIPIFIKIVDSRKHSTIFIRIIDVLHVMSTIPGITSDHYLGSNDEILFSFGI